MTNTGWIYVILLGPAILVMLVDLVTVFRLAVVRRGAGMGRVLFGALLTLKIWVMLVLGYFTWIIVWPNTLTYQERVTFGLLILVYIFAQALGVLVALARWYGQPAWLRRRLVRSKEAT